MKDQFKLNCREHSFANRYINEWNNLPETVVESPSIAIFKKRLDEYLNSL